MSSRQPPVAAASMMDKCGYRYPPDGSRIWLPELVEHFASFLHPNDVACNLRLVNKATAAQFQGRWEFTTVRLSQPVPAHAFARRWGTAGAVRSLTLKQRRELLRLTAASGSVPNLEVALAHAGLFFEFSNQPALCAAAAAGHLNTYEFLLSHQGFALDEIATRAAAGAAAAAAAAAQAGQREVCEVLFSRGVVCNRDTVCAAARGGHPDLLYWLLLRWPPEGQSSAQDNRLRLLDTTLHRRLLEAAATGCSLQVLRDLHQRCGGEEGAEELWQGLPFAINAAAASPTPDWRAKVEWLGTLAQTPPPWSGLCFLDAASCPDALARLTWLRQRGYAADWSAAAFQAARSGNVAALEYLLDEGVKLRHLLEGGAAEAGQLGVLTTLHARGYPVGPARVAFEACRGGHLPVVVWAVETLGAEVRGNDFLQVVATSGSVELMSWLRQHGASWSTSAFNSVTNSGCEKAVEWAVAQGCPMPANGEPYVCAALNGDLATLRCLRRLGCPWGPAGDVFARCVRYSLPLPVLQLLVKEGCVVDWQAALAEAKCRAGPGVRAWLEEQVYMQLGPEPEEGPSVPFRVQ